MNTFELEILSPEGSSFKGNVVSATFPTAAGEITVFAGHVNLVTKLVEGEIIIRPEKEDEKKIIVSGGFMEIFAGKVNVIAEFAMQSGANKQKIEQAMQLAKDLKEKRKNTAAVSIDETQLKKSVYELKSGVNLRRKK